MRWWACDNGHSNPIRSNRGTGRTWDTCMQCPESSGAFYCIELGVAEDDPARFVPPPDTKPDLQLRTTKENHHEP